MNFYRTKQVTVVGWVRVGYPSYWDDTVYSVDLLLDSGIRTFGCFRLTAEEVPLVESWLKATIPCLYSELPGTRIPGVRDRLFFLNPPIYRPQAYC